MTIPRFLRHGPKNPFSKSKPAAINQKIKEKTQLQQFLTLPRPSLSRETGIRLISLSIARAHARTGRGLDPDWR